MRTIRLIVLVAAGGMLATLKIPAVEKPDTTAADEQTLKAVGMAITDQSLIDFFQKRTLNDADRDKIKLLIEQLGDDQFEVRESASAKLIALGSTAEPLLKTAMEKSDDVEVIRRAEECLKQIKRGAGAAIPAAAARLLARRKPPQAAEALLGYLPFADSGSVTEEIRKALAALALRDGKPDPALLAALADKSAAKRAAAAEAFSKAQAVVAMPAVKKLLQDPEPDVRLQVALFLVAGKDKDPVPVLIDLLGILPREQSWQAEEVLLRLAGEKAPNVNLGSDQASREKCRQAWGDWWKEHGALVNMARLTEPPPILGYTLVVLLDAGKIMELDKEYKPRWQFDNVSFPLDAELLANNHVLVAEHQANRITQRDTKGKIIWQHNLNDAPLVAQRLANGNTFIATNNRLLEVTMANKEVFSFFPPNGEMIMKATKLRNGEIACVYSPARFVRLDANFKELKSFPVNVRTSGGRIHVLANNHVIVAEKDHGRVAEYDGDGKLVWEAKVEEPIAAVRIPNGNTLVTSMTQNRAVEIDPKGKEVWQFKADTRVNRAFRR